jgi:hypothetical protein
MGDGEEDSVLCSINEHCRDHVWLKVSHLCRLGGFTESGADCECGRTNVLKDSSISCCDGIEYVMACVDLK